MNRYGKGGGWHGDSKGHSLAAKGVSLYAKKSHLMDPVFAAKKSEEELPSSLIMQMVKDGMTFEQIKHEHPDVDSESVRKKGIKAVDACSGSNTMSTLDKNGVDMSVKIAKVNKNFRVSAQESLRDSQKSSYLPEIKAQLLKKHLGELDARV